MEPKAQAVHALLTLCEQFAAGALSYDDFEDGCHEQFGDVWEAETMEESVRDLPADLQSDALFCWEWYAKSRADEFRNPDWVYGSPERTGWIDKRAYQSKFAEAFRRFAAEGDS